MELHIWCIDKLHDKLHVSDLQLKEQTLSDPFGLYSPTAEASLPVGDCGATLATDQTQLIKLENIEAMYMLQLSSFKSSQLLISGLKWTLLLHLVSCCYQECCSCFLSVPSFQLSKNVWDYHVIFFFSLNTPEDKTTVSGGVENKVNPEYTAFILVPVFFLLGLLGVVICHVLKRKGYRCTTEAQGDDEVFEEEEVDPEMGGGLKIYVHIHWSKMNWFLPSFSFFLQPNVSSFCNKNPFHLSCNRTQTDIPDDVD